MRAKTAGFKTPSRSFPAKLFWSLLGIVLILLGVHLFLQHLNLAHGEQHGQIFELSNRVDFDDENSLPTWFSQFLLLSVSAAAWLASRFETGRLKKLWMVASCLGLVLAIDEVAGLHEFVLQTMHLIFYGESTAASASLNSWWLILPFVIALGVAALVVMVKWLPRRTWALLVAGGLVYLTGAIGFEIIGNDVSKASFAYQGLVVGLEEGLEMVGAIIWLYGLTDYLRKYHGAALSAVYKQLRPAGK